MGKGDKRTRRGKIYRGSFGKSRPKVVEAKSPKRAPAKAPASAPSRAGGRSSSPRSR